MTDDDRFWLFVGFALLFMSIVAILGVLNAHFVGLMFGVPAVVFGIKAMLVSTRNKRPS